MLLLGLKMVEHLLIAVERSICCCIESLEILSCRRCHDRMMGVAEHLLALCCLEVVVAQSARILLASICLNSERCCGHCRRKDPHALSGTVTENFWLLVVVVVVTAIA